MDELRTSRLLLRRWRIEDLEPFGAMNADPEVMELFPAALERASSDALVDRIEAGFAARGFGLWALEVASSGSFIGFTGLSVPGFEAAFTPAVEIGWRLARGVWGQGYATEAGFAVLDAAFGPLGLTDVVSFTSVANLRSQAVMRRLGMTHEPAEDFDHPSLPPDHRLARHVLYRTTAARWHEQTRRTGGPK
ncbi:MAG: GNAT family N-acetyltransferase [Actinobacteria bacterium]|jgi:ribosomal-protein-alanine N-acetyltransferase|nr:GNAT family N-acetyltransferase [Actinomycetota bacterium]MDA8183344.1 GNAT family N-acetyltransferase [Actinomycetota bacterium]